MSPSALDAHEKREFARDLKFLVDTAKAAAIRGWAREHLICDPNARGPEGDTYDIASIYFDNDLLDVFHHRRRLHHSKFRIRRYGAATVFLERKLKIRGRLAKRRTAIVPDELARLHAEPDAAWPGRWFQRKITGRQLHPVCQIAYSRTARVLMTPSGPIRLTLDESIRATPADDIAFRDRPGEWTPICDRVVLEFKFRRDLPALFREAAERFVLTPQPFSKYRAAVVALGIAPAAATTPAEAVLQCQTS
jgi:hypothetical protein